MASLERLPAELLINIAKDLRLKQITRLLQTSRTLYTILSDELYREGVRRDALEYGQPISLLNAVHFGCLDSFGALITRTKDIDSPIIKLDRCALFDQQGVLQTRVFKGLSNLTILQAVCSLGSNELVKLVLESGADTEVRNDLRLTALHQSVILGRTSMVEMLIDGGANVLAFHQDNTPLNLALFHGNIAIARMLIAAGGANVEIPLGPSNPLFLAVKYQSLALVQQLLQTSGSYFPEPCLTAALPIAIREGNADITCYLISLGAKPTPDALGAACEKDDLGLMKHFIDAGIDVTGRQTDGTTALFSVRSIEAAKMMLNESQDLAKLVVDGKPAVDEVYRVYSTHKDMDIIPLVELLLEYGLQMPNADDIDPRMRSIHYAAMHGHKSVLRMILEKQQWQIATLDDSHATALHYAAGSSSETRFECVQLLIESGADVSAVDGSGKTVLHCLFHNEFDPSSSRLTKYLCEIGADVCHVAADSTTALHRSLKSHDPESALILIEAGADVLAQDESEIQPLHLASEQGYFEVARKLIRRGADVSARGSGGYTPLHLAIFHGWLQHREEREYVEAVELVILGGNPGLGRQVNFDQKPSSAYNYLALIHLLCSSEGNLSVRISELDLNPVDFVRMQRLYWNEFASQDHGTQTNAEAQDTWWKLGTYLNWEKYLLLN